VDGFGALELGPLFAWGLLYGHIATNPATAVPALKRPDDMPRMGTSRIRGHARRGGAVLCDLG
jgi:hypothetical protein